MGVTTQQDAMERRRLGSSGIRVSPLELRTC